MKRLLASLGLVLALATLALGAPARATGFVSLTDSGGVNAITAANPLPTSDQHSVTNPVAVNQAIGVSVQGASGNVANASAVATLAGTAGKTTYITGFQCSGAGATAVNVVNATVVGGTWTETFTFVFVAGVTTADAPLIVTYPIPIPASAANTAITVTLPASGSGGTNAACNAQGYQL